MLQSPEEAAMSPIPARSHPRTQLYLPSSCTALLPRDRTVTLEGKTDTVGRGGLRLLLPTLLKMPNAGHQGISIVLSVTRVSPAPCSFHGGTDLGQVTLFQGAYS
jgi:hypothetical protein